MKKQPGKKWKIIPYGKGITRPWMYEPDDNPPCKKRARRVAKEEIKKEVEDEIREKE